MKDIEFRPGMVVQCVDKLDGEVMSTFVVYHACDSKVVWAHLKSANKMWIYPAEWKDSFIKVKENYFYKVII